MLRRFDGIAEDGRQFLVNLQHEIRRNLSIQDWIETVWAQFTDQASEWINNEKEMMVILDKESSTEADKNRFIQLICEKYPVVKKPVVKKSVVSCERYSIQKPVATKPVATKPVVMKSVAAKVIDIKQNKDETIREYYERFNNLSVQAGSKDDVNKHDLGYEELLLLFEITENWIQGLNNRKLRRKVCSRYLYSNSLQAQSLFGAYTAAERQQKEALQQQLQDIVDRDVARTQKSYTSPSVLEQIRPEVSETCTAVDITDIETPAKPTASESVKWTITPTCLQKPSPEANFVDESLPILEEIPCDLSETSTDAVDNCDIESTDEVLASGPGKWIAAAAGKEVIGYTSTSDEAAKNPTESASDNSFGWSRCCTVDDVEVLNQEVFALAALYDAFLKNPPASSTEDMEISVAMDMPSLKHLMDMDGPDIEAFDSGTTMGAPSKNPSAQHIEDPETLEKDSAYIYELPALPTFDHGIAIDFETYTVGTSVIQPPVIPSRRKLQLSPFRGLALRNTSFGWSRCCTNPIGSRTSSASTCTSTSDVSSVSTVECATTMDTDFCEGEQLSCSSVKLPVSSAVECTTESDTDFYEGEQSSCSTNAVCTFVVVVNIHAALTLIVGMVMKNPAWMSFSGSSEYLAPKPKHKGLPKVKIKR